MSITPFVLSGALLWGFAAPLLKNAPPVEAQAEAAAQQNSSSPSNAPAGPAAPSSPTASAGSSTPAAPAAPAAPTAPAAPEAAHAAIPASAAALRNPVHSTAASQARALQIYGYDCELCHGKGGDGVSEIDPKTKLRDYRDSTSLQGLTDGQIFYIIQNGQGSMPGEGTRAKPDEVWNLVIYLRSLSQQKGRVRTQVGVRSNK